MCKMALSDKIAKEMSRALREVAKTFNFKDKNFIKIIRKATNLYQMLQEINYSGRLDNAESLIASRVFVHIDAIAELADEQKAGDEVEALLAAFKCLMNSMKARGVATGSLFIDNKKADIDWDILEGDDCEEYVVIAEDLGA